MWIKFLVKNWHFIAIAILMASNYFTFNMYLDKRDDLVVCETNYKNKEAEVVSCNDHIDSQNIKIQEWVLKGEVLEKRVKELTYDISVIESKYAVSIQAINDAKVPETCDGSMRWLVEQGKKL